jgi:hypothetical protein
MLDAVAEGILSGDLEIQHILVPNLRRSSCFLDWLDVAPLVVARLPLETSSSNQVALSTLRPNVNHGI